MKLRAGEEPPRFKVEFTADNQTAAFQFLGSSKAEPTERDTHAELALFAIVQFLEEGAMCRYVQGQSKPTVKRSAIVIAP